jgi:hypothetical protein
VCNLFFLWYYLYVFTHLINVTVMWRMKIV